MSWAEFVLRSIGFREQREFDMKMHRESAYWGYRASMIFSKKKPVNKDEFWPIGKGNEIENTVSEEMKSRFREETAKWEQKRKKDA